MALDRSAVGDGAGLGPEPLGALPSSSSQTPASLGALVRAYLKISLLGFGGPNAHIALMLDEVVERRKWLSRERFLEIVALTNLLPGPNSSEVAIHVGYTQQGVRGALASGLTFLAPTFLLVTALSAVYFRFGALPQVEGIFWGLQPVIVAIVLSAGWKMARAGVTSPAHAALAVVGAGVSILSGQAVIAFMVVGGAVTWWMRRGERGPPASTSRSAAAEGRPTWFPIQVATLGVAAGALSKVFLTHLWIGSVLFGGGYVMVALLQPYAVEQYGWLSNAQFLDGVALTQTVPGPISTLSAFVGYAAAGVPGALLATAGIYIPSFAAVLLVAPRMERLRKVDGVRHALGGVVAVAAGAVAGVGLSLAVAGVRDVPAGLIVAVALVLATRRNVPALWLVGGGLVAGAVRILVG